MRETDPRQRSEAAKRSVITAERRKAHDEKHPAGRRRENTTTVEGKKEGKEEKESLEGEVLGGRRFQQPYEAMDDCGGGGGDGLGEKK